MRLRTTTSYDPHIKPKEISLIRHKLHLSQDQFARALHINVHTLRNWEQGLATPGPSTILLLKLLDIHPELIQEIDYILEHPIK